jgi:hypothetical protein
MLTNQDIHNIDSINTAKDSVFVPLFIKKNPEQMNMGEGDNITCKEYIFSLVKDSELKQPQKQTLFKEKTSYSHSMQMIERENTTSYDWIFGMFLFMVFLFAILVRFAGSTIFSFLQGCFSSSPVSINTKNGTTIHTLALLPSILIFLPLLTFVGYCAFNYFDCSQYLRTYSDQIDILLQKPLFLWLGIYICLLLSYFLKICLVKFFAWVFRAKKIANYYVQIMLNFAILGGFLLILPTFFAVYINNFYEIICLSLCLFLFVLLMVIRMIRTFSVIINIFKFSYVYLFFYLCIVEILPILMVLKLLFF